MNEIECAHCGEDCSHAYGTYMGYPFHFGCLPRSKKDLPDYLAPDWDQNERDAEPPHDD